MTHAVAARALVAASGALALLTGCGSSAPDPLPVSCLQSPAAISRALASAPASVRLSDGTQLSRCVSRARPDGDLQAMGVALTQVADALRERAGADSAAALQLGYLVGAVRRGAAATPGTSAQLARRVELAARVDADADAAAPRRALLRGIRLGEAGG